MIFFARIDVYTSIKEKGARNEHSTYYSSKHHNGDHRGCIHIESLRDAKIKSA